MGKGAAEARASRGSQLDTASDRWLRRPAVLPSQYLREAVARKWVRAENLAPNQVQPASIDLTLGSTAYRLLCSFLPDTESTVEEKLKDYVLEEMSITEGAILERNRAYLIPLREDLSLPEALRAKANPKSSTGRLDIFTRLICDNNPRFDEVRPGYQGRLYLEVIPRSFIVRVREGLALNQLRLVAGDPGKARYSDRELDQLHRKKTLLWREDKPLLPTELDLFEGLYMTLDLTPDKHGVVGYRARRHSRVVDLSQVGRYRWDDFWEPVRPEREGRLMLEPEEFYLLLSREAVSVPAECAAEMSAYDPTAGELRTHYAGFFDPGFGYREKPRLCGSRATLEVRARDVSFMVEHGQRLCKLVFERLAEKADVLYGAGIGSTYQNQRLTLSKHFAAQGGSDQATQLSLARPSPAHDSF